MVLFDNGTPRPLAAYLIEKHMVTEARSRGWDQLENGELLTEAEAAGFEVLITTDKNLRFQQNLTSRRIAVVVSRKGTMESHQAPCRGYHRGGGRSDCRKLH